MKPKFTTSGNEYILQVRSKLSTPFSEKTALLFTCFPELGIGSFSIQFLEEETPVLLIRKWKLTESAVFPMGIHLYDLNNIAITEKRIILTETGIEMIRGIRQMDWSVSKSEALMLDGIAYSLSDGEKTIHWTMIDTLSPELQESVTKWCNLVGLQP